MCKTTSCKNHWFKKRHINVIKIIQRGENRRRGCISSVYLCKVLIQIFEDVTFIL